MITVVLFFKKWHHKCTRTICHCSCTQNWEHFEVRRSGFFAAVSIPCREGLLDPGKRAKTFLAAVVEHKIQYELSLRAYHSSGRREGHAS